MTVLLWKTLSVFVSVLRLGALSVLLCIVGLSFSFATTSNTRHSFRACPSLLLTLATRRVPALVVGILTKLTVLLNLVSFASVVAALALLTKSRRGTFPAGHWKTCRTARNLCNQV